MEVRRREKVAAGKRARCSFSRKSLELPRLEPQNWRILLRGCTIPPTATWNGMNFTFHAVLLYWNRTQLLLFLQGMCTVRTVLKVRERFWNRVRNSLFFFFFCPLRVLLLLSYRLYLTGTPVGICFPEHLYNMGKEGMGMGDASALLLLRGEGGREVGKGGGKGTRKLPLPFPAQFTQRGRRRNMGLSPRFRGPANILPSSSWSSFPSFHKESPSINQTASPSSPPLPPPMHTG